MFRLANNGGFEADKKLYEVATECLTETIKIHLEQYFLNGYEKELGENLYTKVDYDAVTDLLPDKLFCELYDSGIDEELFLKKKMAEFMNILYSKESITPDIFIEYLLYRMIITEDEEWFIESEKLKQLKPILKELLVEESKEYAKEMCSMDYDINEDGEYINEDGERVCEEKYNKEIEDYRKEYIERTMTNLTNLPNMSIGDDSMVFWDWDFSFFDDWGFEIAMRNISAGPVGEMMGYGGEYIENIFKSSNIEVPEFLTNN